MKWISALNLDSWANTIGSRTALSELISKLVRASVAEITAFRFPTGDSAQIPGYDGSLTATRGLPYVPEGQSVWEFGTESTYLEKANRDFNMRSAAPGGIDPAECTFVCVTPRTWVKDKPSLEEWQREKTSQGPWKDVKLIDGAKLETWLENSPAVAAYFARQVLPVMPETGARSTDEFWEEFSSRFKLPLTEEVLLCGRAKQAGALLPQLMTPTGSYLLHGDTAEEVVAFAVAAIRKADNEVRKYLESRTLIVDTQEAARSLMASKNLTFFALPAVGAISGALSRRNPVLIPITREDSRSESHDALRPPTAHDLSEALRSMGLSQEQAIQLARRANRRITVLGRLFPSASAPRPAWAVDQDLVPALLLGGWNADAEEDRKIVCAIAGSNSYDQYEERLRKYLKANDSPLEREGSVWHLVSSLDAFTHLAHLIGGEHLTRLRAACQTVFAEHHPALESSPEGSTYSGLFGKKLKHSSWLRDGLATTLLMFAALEEGTGLRIHNGAQHYVDDLIRSLPGLRNDWRVIGSLSAQLPLLMEAAPRPLLEALEQMLGGDGSSIRPIFRDTDAIFSSSPHTGLLWALETIAWDSEYLARVSLILARLARIDPGGKLSNRPIESLRAMFLPWLPNTNAPLAQRLSTLDYIIANEPRVGWQLILKLLPEYHSIGTHTAMPRFREAGASEKEIITQGLVWETYNEIIDRVLRLAGSDPERWTSIIQSVPTFGPPQRERVCHLLENLLNEASDEQRTELWAPLRDLVNNHRAFQDAPWAMKDLELRNFESILEKLQPHDPIARSEWLFDDHHPRLPIPVSANSFQEVEKIRVDVIRQLYDTNGVASVKALAERVKLPRFVGLAASAVIGHLEEIAGLIDFAFQKGGGLAELAMGLSVGAMGTDKQNWMALVEESSNASRWTPDQVATLLLWWNDDPETWSFVASLGPDVERSYWQRKSAWSIKSDRATAEMAAQKYLAVGRPLAALGALHNEVEIVEPELLFQALDQAIPEIASSAPRVDTMTAYEVETIFDALGKRPDVPIIEIAKREYAYLPLLSHRSKTLTLHHIMATEASFFVSVLCDVFKPASGEAGEPDEQQRRRARAGYQLLSGMETVPGLDGTEINRSVLKNWIKSVRELAAQDDRAQIADEYIGHLLAHSPSDQSGTWPHEVVSEILEELHSDSVENGILIERHNMRGPFHKAMYEGGIQERGLGAKATEWAEEAIKRPRTHSMLLRLARSWNEYAKREDERARQDEMKFEQ